MQTRKGLMVLVFGMVVLIVAMFVASFTWAAPSTTKALNSSVGYVNMERIEKEHPDFISLGEMQKDKESEMNFFTNYLNKQLEGIYKDLKTKADQEKTGKLADEQAKIEQRYDDEFQKKKGELNNQLTQKNNEVSGYLSQQKKTVMDKLTQTIETIVTEKNLTIVLDKRTLYYGGIDITQDVLDKVKVSTPNNDKTDKAGKTSK